MLVFASHFSRDLFCSFSVFLAFKMRLDSSSDYPFFPGRKNAAAMKYNSVQPAKAKNNVP